MGKNSTQSILEIKHIDNGIIEMDDGGLRTILIVSSTNFALKSYPEQQALLASYHNFLNTLSFPLQILVQSRRLDLSDYLKQMEESSNTQNNPLLRQQMLSYVVFVRELLSTRNIMAKNFYVTVAFNPDELTGVKRVLDRNQKQKAVDMLLDRTALVANSLAGLGLLTAQLNTQEIVELFYLTLNGQVAHREKIYSLDAFSGLAIQGPSAPEASPPETVVEPETVPTSPIPEPLTTPPTESATVIPITSTPEPTNPKNPQENV